MNQVEGVRGWGVPAEMIFEVGSYNVRLGRRLMGYFGPIDVQLARPQAEEPRPYLGVVHQGGLRKNLDVHAQYLHMSVYVTSQGNLCN